MSEDVIVQELITYDILIENFIGLLKDEKFDIVHTHDTAFWLFAKKMSQYFNAPLVTTTHLALHISHDYHPSDFWRYIVTREGTAYHESNRVIAVSESYKEELIHTYMVDEDKVVVIPNGVNYELLSKVRVNGAPFKCDKLIVFVGRMVPTKGLDTLLDVIEKFPEHHFVLISSISPTLEDDLPLSKRVKMFQKKFTNLTWFNHLSDDPKWSIMKTADIGVVPSNHEPFGIVALEWMALDVPLIVTKVGGLIDFCTEENSTLIEPNVKSLEQAIRTFVRDEKKIEKARETARQYTWERTSERTKKIYEEVLNERKFSTA
jgi:1,4-alpha-glucan branching enzyme